MTVLKQDKNDRGIPVTEANRPDQVETGGADSTLYTRWRTPGNFDENDVFTEDVTKKVVICRSKTAAGMMSNDAAYDLWSNRAAANYVPWSRRTNIIK
jgi:hypothetical protein